MSGLYSAPGSASADRLSFPSSVKEITAAWLTDTLRGAGVLGRFTSVEDIISTPIGAESGMSGSLARLELTYDADTGGPSSLIAKFSAEDEARRRFSGGVVGLYGREISFYSALAAHTGVVTPKFYYGAIDPGTFQSILLLEDLGGGAIALDDECTAEQARAALAAIAHMHARWWNSPELANMEWLGHEHMPGPQSVEIIRTRYPTFLDRFSDAVDEELRHMLERLASGELPRFSDVLTLYHGDFSLKNVCYWPNGRLTIFDWQLVGHGPPAIDVQRLVSGSLSLQDWRQQQSALLSAYMQVLADEGVSNYTLDVLERDCQAAVALRLRRAISIGGGPGELDVLRTNAVLHNLRIASQSLDGCKVEELFG